MTTEHQRHPLTQGPLLAVEDAAAYLQIAVWTLRHWVSDRKIPSLRPHGPAGPLQATGS